MPEVVRLLGPRSVDAARRSIRARDARGDRRYYVQAQLRPDVSPRRRRRARLRLLAAQSGRRINPTSPSTPASASASSRSSRTSCATCVRRSTCCSPRSRWCWSSRRRTWRTRCSPKGWRARASSRSAARSADRRVNSHGSCSSRARSSAPRAALLGAAAAAFLLPQLLSLIPFGYVPGRSARRARLARRRAPSTACAVGCGLVIGLVPALRAASVDPAALLKHGDTRTGSGAAIAGATRSSPRN